VFIIIKAKARDSDIARLTGKPDQPRFTIIEVAVDRQEPFTRSIIVYCYINGSVGPKYVCCVACALLRHSQVLC